MVSGVTAAPSEMPSTMLAACGSGLGTSVGRRMSAAAATAMIAPESQPAGKFVRPSTAPPAAPMVRGSARRMSAARTDAADAISGPRRHLHDEPLHGGLELAGIAGKAQAQIALPGGAERGAGRKPDGRFIDEAQRQAARVVLALDREEHVEGALRN